MTKPTDIPPGAAGMAPGPEVEVPRPLDAVQVRTYVEEGYLAVEGLITGSEVEALRGDVVEIARGGYPSENFRPLPAEASDEEALANVLCIHQPHNVSPVIEQFVRHPAICGALSQLAGAHLPFWDGSVKCMQSMYFVKPPGFPGQGWHQDEVYIPTRDRSLIGAWIALDDATVENGCLGILPGSHRSGYLYSQRSHENPEEFDGSGESYGFDESGEQPVEVKAGTLVFFNGYLLHRSRRNRSSQYRRVLVNHYCNAWSLLPWRIEEGERPATADYRRVIQVAGSDPYAWKGYDTSPGDCHMRWCKANRPASD